MSHRKAHSQALPVLAIDYCETTPSARLTRFGQVNKSWRRGVNERGEVIWLLLSLSQAKDVKLTVHQEILDEQAFTRERADFNQAEIDRRPAEADSRFRQPRNTG